MRDDRIPAKFRDSWLLRKKKIENCVLIHNIAPDVSWRSLKYQITKDIPVCNVEIIRDDNQTQKTAVVEFRRKSDVAQAIQTFSGMIMFERELEVSRILSDCELNNYLTMSTNNGEENSLNVSNIENYGSSYDTSFPTNLQFENGINKEFDKVTHSNFNVEPDFESGSNEHEYSYNTTVDYLKTEGELFKAATNCEIENNIKIIVENLNCGISISDLYSMFKQIGEIISYDFYDEISVRKRKSAYIVFKSCEEALRAIATFYGKVLVDEVILVSLDPDSLLLKYLKLYENVTNYEDINYQLISKMCEKKSIFTIMNKSTTNLLTVHNLSDSVTLEHIQDHFIDADGIIDIKLKTDMTGRQVALLQYCNDVNSGLIKKILNGTNLKGNKITIKL